MRDVRISLGLLALMLGCGHESKQVTPKEDVKSFSEVEHLAIAILEKNAQPGSLVYEGVCSDTEGIVTRFKLTVPRSLAPASSALAETFKDAPEMTFRSESGLIRIVGGGSHCGIS